MIKKNLKIKKLHLRRGDTVVVLSGKDKGKRGKVLATSPKESKIMVSGLKIVSKHVKAKKQGQEFGIIKTESAFYACKAKLVCPHCDKPTRISYVFEDKKCRACKKCKKVI